MKVFKFNEHNDIYFDKGMLVMMENTKDSIIQNVKTEMMINYGEWFGNTTVGLPYLQEDGSGIFDNRSPEYAESKVIKLLKKYDKYFSISGLTFSLSKDRRLDMDIILKFNDGSIEQLKI